MKLARFDSENRVTPEWLEVGLDPASLRHFQDETPHGPTVHAFRTADLDTFVEAVNRAGSCAPIAHLGYQQQAYHLARIFRDGSDAAVHVRYTGPGRFAQGIEPLLNLSPQDARQAYFLGVSSEVFEELEKSTENSSEDAKIRLVRRAYSGTSPGVDLVCRRIVYFGPDDLPVLIHGESGTGKELVAHALFAQRKVGPFVAVSCPAFAPDILDSELFGHEKGAFTGAIGSRMGLIELAKGGTLFLDEVGDMSLEMQAKLLRALQEGVIRRVGGNMSIPIDVRVISATSRDLFAMMEEGTFRSDLFYRLSYLMIRTPSLCEDRGNFEGHVRRLWKKRNSRSHLSRDVIELLWTYDWPGNVRQLDGVLAQLARGYPATNPTVEEAENVLIEKTTGRIPSLDRRRSIRRDELALRKDIEGFSGVREQYAWLARTLHKISSDVARDWLDAPMMRAWTLPPGAVAKRLQRGEADRPVGEQRDLCGLRAIVTTQDQKRDLIALLGTHLDLECEHVPVDLTDTSFYPVKCWARIDGARVPEIESAFESAVPEAAIGCHAEIQVWTLFEAARASLREDVPEAASASQELEELEWTLSWAPGEVDDVLRAGQLATRLSRWKRAIELLSPYAGRGGDVARDLGLALCQSNPVDSDGYQRGLDLLRKACQRSQRDSDVIASGIETWKRSGRKTYALDFNASDARGR